MSEIKNTIKAIVRFIENFYDIRGYNVTDFNDYDINGYTITIYVPEISDDLISNPQHGNLKKHKEDMLTRRIRTDIDNYLGIKTYGTQPRNNFFSPLEKHPIKIVVNS